MQQITEIKIETKAASCAWAAYKDAQMRSTVNRTHYTPDEIRQIESAKNVLEMLVEAKGIFVEFRKKFATVKIHGINKVPSYRKLHDYEAHLATMGVVKAVSEQGVTYRFPIQH